MELNANGSVVLRTADNKITFANSQPVSQMRSPAYNGEDEETEILGLATAEARHYGHAIITFDHILSAILQAGTQELDAILSPRIKTSSLKSMLEKDLKNVTRHPPDSASELRFGTETRKILLRAEIAVQNWATGRLFGAELLHSMLRSNAESHTERSTTLDYIAMMLSNHCTQNSADVVRKAIDSYAIANSENLKPKPSSDLRYPC